MKHEIIEIPVISEAIRRLGAPTSALTRVGGFLYTCGMPPIDLKTGEIVRGDMTTQARACMDALSFTLRHAGSSLDNVFKSLVFITDNDLAAEMNAVYRAYFPGGFPARSCVAIKPWTHFDVEIEWYRDRGMMRSFLTGNRSRSHKRTQCLPLSPAICVAGIMPA
jgi:2-iminobutanoate/2-iminopropanoate deaminase